MPFPEQLEQYVTWMRRERGLSPETICVRSRPMILADCGGTGD
jgi:hypothetical protein